MTDEQLALVRRHAEEGVHFRPGDVNVTYAEIYRELVRLREDVAMYRGWCARLPSYEHECACGSRFSLRSTPALVDQLSELVRLRGIEQQARALSIRNDRLYDAFVDATGYEPTLELGDDDD